VTHLRGKERTIFVQRMFARIAQSYDMLNRIMTFGQDMKWRREAVQALAVHPGGRILDLGSGTGDILFEALQTYPQSTVVGVDITPEMVQIGRRRKELDKALWVIADVQNLPFAPSTFHGTISAFLLRNLSEVSPILKEQLRVLCDGGKLVCLETTPAPKSPLSFITRLYLKRMIPILGSLIAQDMDAYTYLANSTTNFIPAEILVEKLTFVGFLEVNFTRRMFGMIAIHIAKKPDLYL
jgi:demethylmenaquinone methyltransferase/2-methoxy-6-polyprenyl-1,4-benzoquinol methylase